MKLKVYQLTLEIVRLCNMHCKHCLRGDVENINMAKEEQEELS